VPGGSGPDAVAAQGRFEQVEGSAGGLREHLGDLVTRLALQDASRAFGEQHAVNRRELGCRDPSLRFLRPDAAIMVISGVVTLAGQSATAPDHKSVQTFVLIKNDGHWRVTAFQNTRQQVQS
jgi:uncharacterized protein (TIGR02246 family)